MSDYRQKIGVRCETCDTIADVEYEEEDIRIDRVLLLLRCRCPDRVLGWLSNEIIRHGEPTFAHVVRIDQGAVVHMIEEAEHEMLRAASRTDMLNRLIKDGIR